MVMMPVEIVTMQKAVGDDAGGDSGDAEGVGDDDGGDSVDAGSGW